MFVCLCRYRQSHNKRFSPPLGLHADGISHEAEVIHLPICDLIVAEVVIVPLLLCVVVVVVVVADVASCCDGVGVGCSVVGSFGGIRRSTTSFRH